MLFICIIIAALESVSVHNFLYKQKTVFFAESLLQQTPSCNCLNFPSSQKFAASNKGKFFMEAFETRWFREIFIILYLFFRAIAVFNYTENISNLVEASN